MNREYNKELAEMGLVTYESAQRALPILLNNQLTRGCRKPFGWRIARVEDDQIKRVSQPEPWIEIGQRTRTITIHLVEAAGNGEVVFNGNRDD